MSKRPLCIVVICYIIGIIMGLYLKISIVFLLCVFILVGTLNYIIFHNGKVFIVLIVILLGFSLIKIVDNDYEKMYQFLQSDERYRVEAVIASEPIEKEYKIVYEIEIKSINGNLKYKGKHWLLNVKKGKASKEKKDDSLQYHHNQLQFGDSINFLTTIEVPSCARNYMGFNYQEYLKTQKIYGTMMVDGKIELVKRNQSKFLEKLWNCARKNIKENIYQFLPENVRELCLGILIGDKRDIGQEITTNFRKSNLSHMLAVSGAHVSYIISLLTLLFRNFRYRFCKILMIIFLLFFMGLTGFTPSVQRASFMMILNLLAGLVYRKQDIYTNLTFSCLLILTSSPYAILDIGFQLSYAGTLGIILFQKKISKWLSEKIHINNASDIIQNKNRQKINYKKLYTKTIDYVIDGIAVTISANLVIIPIMAFRFHTISFTFWISNLLAGPLLGLISILGLISYFISMLSINFARIIAFPLKYLLYILIWIAKFCSEIPFSTIIVRVPFIFEIVFYYLALYIFYFFSHFKEKILKLFCVFLIIIFSCYVIVGFTIYEDLRIYFVDIGQGDCTLICTPKNETILIDGGGSETGSLNIGEKILLPYLLNRRITKINYMMVSHFDTDHCGALLYAMQKIRVENIIIGKQFENSINYQKFIKIVKEQNIKVYVVEAGQRINIEEDLYFDVLWPSSKRTIRENRINNNSLVCKMVYKDISALFTGDIEVIAEKSILTKYKNTNILESTILKVAHHGSKSSSTEEFLRAIKPKIALIGVGKNNTFGHPNAGVLERIEEKRL